MSNTNSNINLNNIIANNANAFAAGMPELNINQLITLIVDVARGNKKPAAAVKEFADPYISFAKVFARDQVKNGIERGLDVLGMESIANNKFSENLIGITKEISGIVQAYMHGDIDEQEFVDGIGESGIREVGKQVLCALNIPEKLGASDLEELFALSPVTVAYMAFMAAYKELRQAMENLDAAHERHRKIEIECAKSIAMIRKYRMEMEQVVSQYLTERLETFEEGFAAMDRAIIEGDSNGYIRGNVEIQTILGYKVQFTNQSEFDALMNSDEDFKL